MILYHPLNIKSNKKAIELYKDRFVYIYNPSYDTWLFNTNPITWCSIKERKKFTFKDALKLTKHYHTKLEYHFVSEIGEEKTPISGYDEESFNNCTTVSFDRNKKYILNNDVS